MSVCRVRYCNGRSLRGCRITEAVSQLAQYLTPTGRRTDVTKFLSAAGLIRPLTGPGYIDNVSCGTFMRGKGQGTHLGTNQAPSFRRPSSRPTSPPTSGRRMSCRRSSPTLGDQAGWRYVEFFTGNIRNPHTRRAYARACSQFFTCCDQRRLTLTAIQPHDVATYIKQL